MSQASFVKALFWLTSKYFEPSCCLALVEAVFAKKIVLSNHFKLSGFG